MILLNIIISASVTYGVLYYWENIREPQTRYQLVTIEGYPTEDALTQISVSETETLESHAEAEAETLPEDAEPESANEPTPVIRGATVEITIIRNPGVLSSEALRIVNNTDNVVSLEGWTLEDAKGNVLTFPNIQLLRKGVFIEVYSRSGHSTPYEIYWNREQAVWHSGETAVIKDVFGQIQATYRVP